METMLSWCMLPSWRTAQEHSTVRPGPSRSGQTYPQGQATDGRLRAGIPTMLLPPTQLAPLPLHCTHPRKE